MEFEHSYQHQPNHSPYFSSARDCRCLFAWHMMKRRRIMRYETNGYEGLSGCHASIGLNTNGACI